jgi:uncharacterized protein YegP (UPF0339 family)
MVPGKLARTVFLIVEVAAMIRYVSLACCLLALMLLLGITDPAAGQVKKDKVQDKPAVKPATSAVFEIYQDTQKKYRYRLVNSDGTKLAMPPTGYKTREECLHVVEEIRLLAGKAKILDAAPEKKK